MKSPSTKRIAALVVVAAAAGALASAVVAGQLAGTPDLESLGEAIEHEPMLRVAEVPASGSAPARGVFVQLTSSGHFCLWDALSASSRERLGGCNRAEDPLAGRELSVSFSYDGGPAASDVRDARLVGVTSTAVERVYVVMSDGTRRQVALKDASVNGVVYRGFGYRVRPADLRKGLGPTAVIGVNGAGVEIERQTTGFAG